MMLKKALLIALLLAPAARTLAHDGPAEEGAALAARSDGGLSSVTASATVTGTVASLKSWLYHVERWPTLFSDVRALEKHSDGTWSVDFVRFGHPHDFRIVRTPAGVTLELAAADHGTSRLEYALEPLDATHSNIVIRFESSTPPQLAPQQMLGLLQAKAKTDLEDFSNRTSTRRRP